MVDDFRTEDQGAPFNMAIATLMGIRDMFNKISAIQADPFLTRDIKQKLIIELTRSIFEQSSPLIKEEVIASKMNEVLELFESNMKKVIKMTAPGVSTITNETRSIYNPSLEIKTFNLRMWVLRELKKEGYVMPPKKNAARAVGDMS